MSPMNTPLHKAVEICGGQTSLARAIGVTRPYVYNWLSRSNGIPPPEYCVLIEKAVGGEVTRKELRPNDWQNIWPEFKKSPFKITKTNGS